MARYNEILVGRYNRFLQKLFGMKGGAVAPQLASEIAPTFPLFSGVEHRYLESWNHYKSFAQVPAVVAQNDAFALVNPVGSGVIAVIERLVFVDDTISNQAFNESITRNGVGGNLANVSPGISIDSRNLGNSSCAFSSINNVAAGAIIINRYTAPQALGVELDVIKTVNQEMTVLPGDRYLWTTLTVNSISIVNLTWRERVLEDSERF